LLRPADPYDAAVLSRLATYLRSSAFICGSFLLSSVSTASDTIPAAPQSKPIALINADIYTASGDVIRGGVVMFDQGRITYVGENTMRFAAGDNVIDCSGKRIYPGLIDAWTELGLTEIGAVRATNDQAETGRFNPNVRAEKAVNPDSEILPTVRSNGILVALTAPEGGDVAGQAAVLQLDGWTWEDLTLKGGVGLVVNWPAMQPARGWWTDENEKQQIKNRDEALKRLDDYFATAKAYAQARRAATQPSTRAVGQQAFDARYEAMIPVLEGKLPLMVNAEELSQIQAAVAFAKRHGCKLVIVGGRDAEQAAPLLRQHDVPVIIEGVQRMPGRRYSDYDEAFTLPQRLKAAGVKFAISADRGATDVRNLPYHAATAAAFGLSEPDALKSITLWPAQILGVAERVGSVEVGKDATLIVTDGDVLEEPTHVMLAFVQGRKLDLSDRHKRLYEKYRTKYERQGLIAPAAPASQPATRPADGR
jgi:imidazolonepropionase-like amidohydrolase